ncbi:hypothetical protein HDIA_3566 [Hartmannibacter diazotrophicus]|uniref:Surface antigen n=1 Tax=Hartmannibacter diazotrophicus TaxID=1482074 RepID=A0A2C9D9Y6_9HYPH|nr:hypothetical protein [Hartmannibacter diazotrophicus]SON57107.1 hypothetical protein HDIA_3566 [Hartmannibacter diazotrophicus]
MTFRATSVAAILGLSLGLSACQSVPLPHSPGHNPAAYRGYNAAQLTAAFGEPIADQRQNGYRYLSWYDEVTRWGTDPNRPTFRGRDPFIADYRMVISCKTTYVLKNDRVVNSYQRGVGCQYLPNLPDRRVSGVR